jgi:poly-beta-1,6-N-acetyl-D-glucosamine biosynthesis protein PgaD
MNAPIIEQPALQSSAQKLIYGVLTLIAWFVWFYITWPFLGIVSNIIGIKMLGAAQFDAATASLIEQIIMVAWWCVAVAVGMVIFCAAWIVYHRTRFGDGTRRRQAIISQPAIAQAAFGVNADQMQRMQHARRIVLTHGEGGVIEHIDTGPEGGSAPLRRAA